MNVPYIYVRGAGEHNLAGVAPLPHHDIDMCQRAGKHCRSS